MVGGYIMVTVAVHIIFAVILSLTLSSKVVDNVEQPQIQESQNAEKEKANKT